VAAPFGDPYMVRVSGDFLPKLCVVTSARMSVCKLRLQFVERGVAEENAAGFEVQSFLLPAVKKRGLGVSSDRLPRGGSAFSAAAACLAQAFTSLCRQQKRIIARETAVTE
jgi:hypothetical protein